MSRYSPRQGNSHHLAHTCPCAADAFAKPSDLGRAGLVALPEPGQLDHHRSQASVPGLAETFSICLAIQKIGLREFWTCDVCSVRHNRDDNSSITMGRRGFEIAVAQGMRAQALWAKAGADGIALSQSVAQAAGRAVQIKTIGALPAVRSVEFPNVVFDLRTPNMLGCK